MNLDPIWTKPDIAKVLVNIHTMNLKEVGLALCTCTWIEIMTGIGITLYLLYLSQFSLALITVAVFSPLIGFHFVVTKLSKLEDRCVNCRSLGYDAVASTDRIEA